jgi:hypothetical protein
MSLIKVWVYYQEAHANIDRAQNVFAYICHAILHLRLGRVHTARGSLVLIYWRPSTGKGLIDALVKHK